jgi:hypothetical protein
MSATVKTCVVWVGLPTQWNRRCTTPERMRRQFGPFTPQPFALQHQSGTMYLFCVAMDAHRATEIIEGAGAHVCCQPAEGVEFDVSQYTSYHSIRPTSRTTASGEEVYELTTEAPPPEPRKARNFWRMAQRGPAEAAPCRQAARTI